MPPPPSTEEMELTPEEVKAASEAGNSVVYSGGGDDFDPPHVRKYNQRMAELERVEQERGLLDGHELVERTVAAAEASAPIDLFWCGVGAALAAAAAMFFWKHSDLPGLSQ